MGGMPVSTEPVDWVDPLIDSANRRFFFLTTASHPFGLVNLSPDTLLAGDWGGGYRYERECIQGFSHVHGWQLAALPVLPHAGDLGAPGILAYEKPFRHDREEARPGYHRVCLEHPDITCELTATMRVGFHRYQFPAGHEARVLVDLGCEVGPSKMGEARMRRVSARRWEGFVTNLPTMRRPKPVKVYFVLETDRDAESVDCWREGAWIEGGETEGSGAGFALRFTPGGELRMKVALSYTGLAGARLNLDRELPHWDFERTRAEARAAWNRMLGRIRVEGGTETQRVKFYTDIFHALKGRRCVSDVDGHYLDMTGPEPRVRRVRCDANGEPLHLHHNSDAFWGAQWSISLLWSLAYPEVMENFCETLLDMHDNGGLVPRGPSGGNYTFVMTGASSTPFLVAAVQKGICRRDAKEVYAALRKNHFPGGLMSKAGYEHHTAGGGGLEAYMENGYVPWPLEGKGMHRTGPSQTLQYAWEDWCLAQLARRVGEDADAELFFSRSANWRNVFDAETRFMRPRDAAGQWKTPFDPDAPDGFCEGNAYHYRYWVPHDMQALAEALGGPAKAEEELEAQFRSAIPMSFATPHDKHHAARVEYGNQPCTGLAHVFNHLGAPWRAQYWTYRLLTTCKGIATPYGGYGGDEDQGMMGSLNVLLAIGLFDLRGGCGTPPVWEIGCPLFDRVEIDLPEGKCLRIHAPHRQRHAHFVSGVRINGQAWKRCWAPHELLMAGALIEIETASSPCPAWGAKEPPPSHSRESKV
jgi:predicted alpha-1,2-mannosidase